VRFRRRGGEPVDVLAGYSELSEIGKGPFATVYGAVEKQTERPVAVKIFDSGPELMDVLVRDQQATAGVDHPNVIKPGLLGSTSEGHPIVVSDLCRESLGHLVETEGPMRPQDTAGVGVKISVALAVVHDGGRLHHNLKPTNVLMTLMGEPAIADAGLASVRMSVKAIGAGGAFTAIHAAPEMFEAKDLSPASDVYGLASTLYQLLTGRAPFEPFDGESPASVVLRILRDPVAPLPAESVPYALGHLLEAALSKDPAGRPQSASVFGEALREIAALEGWSVALPQPSKSMPTATPTSANQSDLAPVSRGWRGLRRARQGVAPPAPAARNVVLPEEARRGSMDRPPRRS